MGFPGGTVVRDQPVNARDEGDTSLILGSGRSPELGDGNPLQCSCLENFMDWGAWWAPVSWGCKESDTTEHACTHSDWCDVMSHCSFAVPFSNKLVPLSIFSCASWPSIYLLCRNVYLGLQPIFDWVGFFFFFILSCINCLYISEIKLLPVASFVSLFLLMPFSRIEYFYESTVSLFLAYYLYLIDSVSFIEAFRSLPYTALISHNIILFLIATISLLKFSICSWIFIILLMPVT